MIPCIRYRVNKSTLTQFCTGEWTRKQYMIICTERIISEKEAEIRLRNILFNVSRKRRIKAGTWSNSSDGLESFTFNDKCESDWFLLLLHPLFPIFQKQYSTLYVASLLVQMGISSPQLLEKCSSLNPLKLSGRMKSLITDCVFALKRSFGLKSVFAQLHK